MAGVLEGSEAFCRAVAAHLDSALGLPKVGRNVGRGPHVDLAAAQAWVDSPVGDPPPGVSATAVRVVQHVSDSARWGVYIPEDMAPLVTGRSFAGVSVTPASFRARNPDWTNV